MKIKTNILIISIVLTIIIFSLSVSAQKKLINYEATMEILTLKEDVFENEIAEESKFKITKVPISLVANMKIVTSFEEIKDLYAVENIKAGQIVIKSQFDTKENLSVYESESGKERISIKIKAPENGASSQIRENTFVNVYATIRSDIAFEFMKDKERLEIGTIDDGYTIIKLLDTTKVLGVFNADGIEYEKSDGAILDSILIAVTPDEAKIINLIRDLATFNVTGVNAKTQDSAM